jgi:hypothetical protein
MSAPPEKCIFCGAGGKLTKEHIWPRGLHRYLTKGMRKYAAIAGMEAPPPFGSRYRTLSHAGDIHDLQVRCVCEVNCNNGWMRRLENKIRPIIEPLLSGQPVRISPSDQKLLAIWAGMKAMVMEYHGSAWVTTHHTQRKRMMQKQELPARGWKIWIGNFERRKSNLHYAAHPFHIIHGRSKMPSGLPMSHFNGHATTQVVKQLLIQIIRSPVPEIAEKWRFHPSAAAKLRVIWPVSDFSISWPPPAMDDADAEYVSTAFFAHVTKRARELSKGTT